MMILFPIFLKERRDDTYRIILNLKKFNDFVLPHCKLESIEDALNLTTEGCYFVIMLFKMHIIAFQYMKIFKNI